MNNPSLSSLYRRLTARNSACEVDAAALAATLARQPADAEKRAAAVSAMAESAAHAKLAQMLKALQGDAAELADQVQATRRAVLAHARQGATRRHGHSTRLRWVASLAAGVVLAVAVVSIHERDLDHGSAAGGQSVAAHAQSPAAHAAIGDSIFHSGYDGAAQAATAPSDRLFRSDFSEGGT